MIRRSRFGYCVLLIVTVAASHSAEYADALSDFTEAILCDHDNAQAFCHRGRARSAKGQFDLALADYTFSIRLDPQNANAFIGRARVARMETESAAIFVSYDPDRFEEKYGRRYVSGRLQDVIDDYTAAINIDPLDADAFFERAVVSAYAGKHTNTLNDVTEAGSFDLAVQWQSKAIEQATDNDKPDFEKRLDLYRSRRPLRDEWKK